MSPEARLLAGIVILTTLLGGLIGYLTALLTQTC
jgi:hypothetical protein